MSIQQLIQDNFVQSISSKQNAQQVLAEPLLAAIELICQRFQAGNKMLICGNGGSAADAQHFAAEFTGRYEMERRPLPAIALTTDTSAITAIGNDYSFAVIFAKQVEALGQAGDILYAISTSGNSENVIQAIAVAHARGMRVIAMVGKDGGKIAGLLKPGDVSLCVPANRTARIQEVHLLILHTICDGVDNTLFKVN